MNLLLLPNGLICIRRLGAQPPPSPRSFQRSRSSCASGSVSPASTTGRETSAVRVRVNRSPLLHVELETLASSTNLEIESTINGQCPNRRLVPRVGERLVGLREALMAAAFAVRIITSSRSPPPIKTRMDCIHCHPSMQGHAYSAVASKVSIVPLMGMGQE